MVATGLALTRMKHLAELRNVVMSVAFVGISITHSLSVI